MKTFEFKPMQWVLVRDLDSQKWALCQYSHSEIEGPFHHVVCGGRMYYHCIPYKGNKHLLGTTDPYVEPYEPKDGDFVAIEVYKDVMKDAKPWICIFKSVSDTINAYAGLNLNGGMVNKGNNVSYNKEWMEYVRPATEEEKNLLLSKLHDLGKDWDAEKKQIVDWKWLPKEGDSYYYPWLCDKCIPQETSWMGDDIDQCRLSGGWVSRSEKECQAKCDKLNEAIKNVK